MNSRNPTLTRPITPKMRARIASGRCVEKNETATIQMLRMNIQSKQRALVRAPDGCEAIMQRKLGV